jgi:murein DD-endopeptidase MepM/ murein hydrolase activator NlpD
MPDHHVLLASVLTTMALGAQTPPPHVAPQLAVTLTARAYAPGEVLRVDVRGASPLDGVRVRAFGRVVLAASSSEGEWRTLVGIDLDTVPGEYPVEVTARTVAGVDVTEKRTFVVEPKEFPTRTLRVDPRFVTPPTKVRPRIEREARRLGAIFATEEPPSWPGAFTAPIESAVVSGFGVRSVYNGEARSPHGGADFASAAGTPVAAPADGRVVLADDLYYTGGTLVIAHGGGLYSLLAHLSRRDVTEGARVRAGEVVGAVGATGRATGPHLHWTVRLQRARVDPLSLIAATASGHGAADSKGR